MKQLIHVNTNTQRALFAHQESGGLTAVLLFICASLCLCVNMLSEVNLEEAGVIGCGKKKGTLWSTCLN